MPFLTMMVSPTLLDTVLRKGERQLDTGPESCTSVVQASSKGESWSLKVEGSSLRWLELEREISDRPRWRQHSFSFVAPDVWVLWNLSKRAFLISRLQQHPANTAALRPMRISSLSLSFKFDCQTPGSCALSCKCYDNISKRCIPVV